ncbi:MAG: ABC transporter substrate-binding protein [Anaplasmataceae bacterium]|nr:ABC transporter substrate-binding protein [Anaplasmataceae bacterium]
MKFIIDYTRIIFLVFTFCFICFNPINSNALDVDAEAYIRSTFAKIKQIKSNDNDTINQKNKKYFNILKEILDDEGVMLVVFGNYYKELTEANQRKLKDEYIIYIFKLFKKQFDIYTNNNDIYIVKSMSLSEKKSIVVTKIKNHDQDLFVYYLLSRDNKDNKYKLQDIEFENIRFIKNQRILMQNYLKKITYDELIEKIKNNDFN